MHHLPTVTYCHYLAHVWQHWNPIAITVCLLSFIVSSLSSLFFSLYFFAGISSSETAFFSYPVTSPNNQRVYFYIGCSLLSFLCSSLSFPLLPNWQQMAVQSWAYFWWRFLPVKRSPSASSERITGSLSTESVYAWSMHYRVIDDRL